MLAVMQTLLLPAVHRQTQAQTIDQSAQPEAEAQEEDSWTTSAKASAAHERAVRVQPQHHRGEPKPIQPDTHYQDIQLTSI